MDSKIGWVLRIKSVSLTKMESLGWRFEKKKKKLLKKGKENHIRLKLLSYNPHALVWFHADEFNANGWKVSGP